MIHIQEDNFSYLKFKNLSKVKGLLHFISTRRDGNMSISVGGRKTDVLDNRRKFFKMLGIPYENVVVADLVHGSDVYIVKEAMIKEADGLISNHKSFCLTVMVADCLPLIYFDVKEKVLGIAHAGWKGTYLSIASKVVEKMRRVFKSNPKNILVGIGPSICGEHYTIGVDRLEILPKKYFKPEFVKRITEDRWILNLWNLNIHQLIQNGVPKKNIELSGICTWENNNLFYSNRKEGKTGRFMVGAMIKNP